MPLKAASIVELTETSRHGSWRCGRCMNLRLMATRLFCPKLPVTTTHPIAEPQAGSRLTSPSHPFLCLLPSLLQENSSSTISIGTARQTELPPRCAPRALPRAEWRTKDPTPTTGRPSPPLTKSTIPTITLSTTHRKPPLVAGATPSTSQTPSPSPSTPQTSLLHTSTPTTLVGATPKSAPSRLVCSLRACCAGGRTLRVRAALVGRELLPFAPLKISTSWMLYIMRGLVGSLAVSRASILSYRMAAMPPCPP